jgi:predicted Fe-S protein YdhL (DUF1289 family)
MSTHWQRQHVQVGPAKSISKIASPCVRVCKIEYDHCIGCGRTSEDIKEWFYADDHRKQEILKKSGKRISNRMRGVRRGDDCTG